MKPSRRFIYHPVLVAIYPVLSLYARNQFELSARLIFLPLAVILVTAFLFKTTLQHFFQDPEKTAVFTSLSLVLFFSYGHFHELLNVFILPNCCLSRHRIMIPLFFLVFFSAFILIKKLKSKNTGLAWLNGYLNYFALAAVIIVLVRIGYSHMSEVKHSSAIRYFNQKGLPACQRIPTVKPDIYYIILDGYGRADVLKELYNYDNEPFIEELQALGFYVAKKSHSNYHFTSYSLSSSLNMDYLGDALTTIPARSQNTNIFTELVAQNRVVRLLKSMNYRYVHFASGEGLTMDSPYADIRIGDLEPHTTAWWRKLNRFSILLLQTTPLEPWVDNTVHAQSYNRLKYNFDEFLKVPQLPGPKFIFFHVLAPHPPFVFDRDGNEVKNSGVGQMSWVPPQQYVDQLIYVNKRVLEFLKILLAQPSGPSPIVVIQSDHGPGITLGDERRWDDPTPLNLHERLSNFCAVYMPEPGRRMLYESITPVNLFRVIFRSTFGADLDLLPDRMYFGVPGMPLRFRDVTDEVLGFQI